MPQATQPQAQPVITILHMLQSEGDDGRYTKLRIKLETSQYTIDLTHEQVGQLLSGVRVLVGARPG